MTEYRTPIIKITRPLWRTIGIKPRKELIGTAILQFRFLNSGQHHAIGWLVGGDRIKRIDVYEVINGSFIIRTEVQECRTAEARCELP